MFAEESDCTEIIIEIDNRRILSNGQKVITWCLRKINFSDCRKPSKYKGV